GPTNATTPQFAFSTTQAGVTFQCKVDGDYAPCTSPFTQPTPLTDGNYTFSVQALRDSAVLDTATRSSSVGPAAPDTTLELPRHASGQRVAFQLETAELNGSFRCTLDTAAVPCPGGTFVTDALEAGHHYAFTGAAVDAAGNADPTPAT